MNKRQKNKIYKQIFQHKKKSHRPDMFGISNEIKFTWPPEHKIGCYGSQGS